MRFFIRLKNGQPFEHPISEENLKEAFPHISLDNLPAEFCEFFRVAPRIPDTFEVYIGSTYEKIDGHFTDAHHYRQMTEEERTVKLEQIRGAPPTPNWTWDEENFRWIRPKMPENGGPWRFDLAKKDWVIATEPPRKGWVLSPTGRNYQPPFPPPQPENTGVIYRWDDETENWVVVPK